MSDQVVIKEEDDGQVHTEDETDASSRSEVSEDETDWESIVESRSERDTKKRKSKTKAKEVTAKLLKEIGDVVESEDENQTELLQDREEGNQKEKTDNRKKDTHGAQANVRTSLGKHFKGERALKPKFNKKRKQHRIENLPTSERSINLSSEKCNKRKENSSDEDDMQAPQKKKFCLPVKLSLMQNVKTPRHRRRINHTRLKCRYCSKSYLYTGSLKRHENAHRECHRSSIQGRPCGESRRKLKLPKLQPRVQTSKKPVKGHSSKKELGTSKAKGCSLHEAKYESVRKDFLKSNNILPTTDTQKQVDMHYKESETMKSSLNFKSSKPSGNLTRQENAHPPSRPFKCRFCSKTFIHEGSLRSHEISHDDKTFKCSKCEEVFARPDQVEQHEILKHGVKMSLSCPVCKTPFTSSSDCDIHFQKNHVNSKLSADKCEKTSTNSEKMGSDKSTTKKILPHRCKTCGKRFRLQSVLEQHECVYKGKKQFSCRHCTKSFRMLDNCRRHEKKHSTDNSVGSQAGDLALIQGGNRNTNPKLTTKATLRPFKCQYCSKTFSLMAVRNSHEKKHAEEKEHAGDKKIFDHLKSKNANELVKKKISHHDSKAANFRPNES